MNTVIGTLLRVPFFLLAYQYVPSDGWLLSASVLFIVGDYIITREVARHAATPSGRANKSEEE